jgi:hypothetical protein
MGVAILDAKSCFGRKWLHFLEKFGKMSFKTMPKVAACKENAIFDVKINKIMTGGLVLGPNVFWTHFCLL